MGGGFLLALMLLFRASTAKKPPSSGVVSLDAEVAALGRVLASEAANHRDDEREAIAYCVCNISYKVHRSTVVATSNGAGEQGRDRPFSTAQAARRADTALAAKVLAAYPANDPTLGATSFFEPAAQDTLARLGQIYRDAGGACSDTTPTGSRPDLFRARCYLKTAADIRAKWGGEGQAQLATVGRWEFWGHA